MPRTPGSKKLTPEKKAAGALFLVDLAARGTRAVDASSLRRAPSQAKENQAHQGRNCTTGRRRSTVRPHRRTARS
ncbi:hypothetical protein JG688_00018705 [Phytophthora aleatoria]|uniref:Uncharacterized protein n=1 Tax=Phytophthora aleatoria TaxID=2496075 RepID=A0A8J5I167_9STRA|nr:hypothetical protein JG688_00018705 [Phytophthora aleatoria]